MDTETNLINAETILQQWTKEKNNPELNRLDVYIDADDLYAASAAMYQNHWGYLSAITGMDQGPEAGKMEALYHFCEGAAVTTLRVNVPRDGAALASVYQLYPVASFFERELSEMYGITVSNTPDPSRLFTPDDWPAGLFPGRKDFDPSQAVSRAIPPAEGQHGDKFIVPIGPQHPALKEPGHFEFVVDGEIVREAYMRLGYVHRGIEKATEERNWTQNLYLLERICGICSHTHSSAYCQGVEQLAGVEPSPRALALRELVAGLERIHSHLLWLGVAAHEAGFDTLFMYSWRDRETVMDLLENITGNRVNYSMNVLGGVKYDLTSDHITSLRQGMHFLDERTRHYLEIVTTDSLFLQRTRDIGTMSEKEAAYFGLLGPTARASNVARDVRIDAPYGAYKHFPVSMVRETAGDLEARFVVRLKEILVSCNAILTLIDNLPPGELSVKVPRRIPAGETVSRVEAPRGEVFYFIKSEGGENPARIKVRTPSLCNWVSVLHKAIGRQLADVPMLISGMDPCFSCNDRMVILHPIKGDTEIWSWDKLRRYGINYYQQKR